MAEQEKQKQAQQERLEALLGKLPQQVIAPHGLTVPGGIGAAVGTLTAATASSPLGSSIGKAIQARHPISEHFITNNRFKGKVTVWRTAPDMKFHARCEFSLNAVRHKVEVELSQYDYDRDPFMLLQALHERVAKFVASEMLVDISRGVKW